MADTTAKDSTPPPRKHIRWVPAVLGVLALLAGVIRIASGVVARPPAWGTAAGGLALLLLGVLLLRVGRGAPALPFRPRP